MNIVHAILWALVLGGCGSGFAQRLESEVLFSRAMARPMNYAVYTPPDFSSGERLPLVVFLHGGGDGPDCFDRHGFSPLLDGAIRSGQVPRVVVALPRGDLGFWANWYDGSRRYEDWVIGELLPTVAARYGTRPCPQGCHLMGISMGGHGSLRMLLHHPERFASVTSVSGPAMSESAMRAFYDDFLLNVLVPVRRIWGPPTATAMAYEDPWQRLRGAGDLNGVRLLLAWGDIDRKGILDSNVAFHAHLEAHGVPHRAITYAGGHEWDAWRPVLLDALREQVR